MWDFDTFVGVVIFIVLVVLVIKSQTVRVIIAGALVVFCLLLLHGAWAEPVVEGNINLDNRIVVVNDDGSFSTERSFSVEIDGLEVLLPTIIDGEVVSEEEAIRHFLCTGEHLGMFTCAEDANAYAEALHLRQQEVYGASR